MGVQQWGILAINPVQHLLDNWLQGLGQDYPILPWVMAHPLLAIIGILVSLALLQLLLGSISNIIKHLFVSLIKSPYSLLRWLLGKTTIPFRFSPFSASNHPDAGKTQDRIVVTLNRLETCKREQDQLLQELKKLISEREHQKAAIPNPNPSPLAKTDLTKTSL
ncbi:MAG: hypothetical protein HC934_07475 [Acaryochloridaceae cyanobacterium SU_2_1]|nr:hypothetical protein [Acaryochloridaceae cyanobacterium SU_2_1]